MGNGACVQVASWRKASGCASRECVEAGCGAGKVGVRDSADAAGPVLEFAPAAWREFTAGIREGQALPVGAVLS